MIAFHHLAATVECALCQQAASGAPSPALSLNEEEESSSDWYAIAVFFCDASVEVQ